MSRETWRLLSTWDEDAGFHMGLDDLQLERGGDPPTLRLYTWKPDALSLGYFQRLEDVVSRDRASQLVRRMTGGGAIHHVNELTFSITLPAGHPLYRGPVAQSYVRVHSAIVAALASVGVRARLREAEPADSDREGTGMCFHASTPLDLVWNGRKGVGSAQRRRAQAILHHGSIKLAPSELETGVATVEDGGIGLDAPEFAPHLCAAFSRELEIELRPGELAPGDANAARARGARFTAPEMVARR